MNNIRLLLKNEFPVDKDYYYKDVFIYPILITHDQQYDTPGLHDLLNYWFREELEILKDEGLFIYHVKPLTIVNIDLLIYHQVNLLEDAELHTVLDAYFKHIWIKPGKKFKTKKEAEEYILSKVQPFSLFMNNYYTNSAGRKIPPILDIVGPELFKEEYKLKK